MELKQLTLYHSKSLNVPIYIASEVDKVIAELQKQLHDYAQGLYVIQAKAEKELRRQKYKRCLIIISDIKAAMDNAFFVSGEYLDWLTKWRDRWITIANKFKEDK